MKRHPADQVSSDAESSANGWLFLFLYLLVGTTHLFSFVYLITNPLPESLVLVVENGGRLEEGEEPQQVAEKADICHIGMERFHKIMFHTILEHAKRLPPSQVTHDIKAVEVEPVSHIYRLPLAKANLR